MQKSRRGRPSTDEYIRRVGEILRYDVFALEECATFAELPGIEALRRQNHYPYLPTGSALRALINQAVADVEGAAKSCTDQAMQRIAIFLQVWYHEHGTVVQVACLLGMSRSAVTHTVQRRAVELVAKRFLEMAFSVTVQVS